MHHAAPGRNALLPSGHGDRLKKGCHRHHQNLRILAGAMAALRMPAALRALADLSAMTEFSAVIGLRALAGLNVVTGFSAATGLSGAAKTLHGRPRPGRNLVEVVQTGVQQNEAGSDPHADAGLRGRRAPTPDLSAAIREQIAAIHERTLGGGTGAGAASVLEPNRRRASLRLHAVGQDREDPGLAGADPGLAGAMVRRDPEAAVLEGPGAPPRAAAAPATQVGEAECGSSQASGAGDR
jgi:hypothetical protein